MTPGHIAYVAYEKFWANERKDRLFQSIIRQWDDLHESEREAWEAAAKAAIDEYLDDHDCHCGR